jgi:hypothetical protein
VWRWRWTKESGIGKGKLLGERSGSKQESGGTSENQEAGIQRMSERTIVHIGGAQKRQSARIKSEFQPLKFHLLDLQRDELLVIVLIGNGLLADFGKPPFFMELQ